jgi:hypothetical protein
MISAILYGRNDNYGYNLHKRAALSFNCIAEVLDETDEIIFVDYNTPDDFPTFPEAIQDTLTKRARELLRVLRVRPFIHDRFKSKTPLLALEPIARNVAVRRSRPSNRWILSTNTDMIFILQRVGSLTDIVRDLPKGFYHAPRIELPETLWESLDRQQPREIIDTIRDWGWNLHLNEIVFGSDVIRYDGPGDFQLLKREDVIKYHGFNEEMLLGWHVDSNIAKRMGLVYGKVGDLGNEVYGYHCDHTRQVTAAHTHTRTENDWRRFVDEVEAPAIPDQAHTWGCADDEIEEIHLKTNPAQVYVKALRETIGNPLTKPRFAHYVGSTYDKTDYDPPHIMPFLADIFFSAARNLNVTWYAEQTETLCLFASIWQNLGFTGKLMVDDSVFKKGLRRANVHFVPKATALAEADVFVFDFRSAVRGSLPSKGLNRGPDPSKDLWAMFAHVVKYERERSIAGKRSRRIISLNAINNRFENFVRQRVAIAYSPFSGRMRHGFALPALREEEDWLPFLTAGEAGIREGKSIKSINRKLGVLAFGFGKHLESGTYRLVLGINALSEDRQSWTDLPCVLICVVCGSEVLAKRALSGKDLDNPELNFILDVSQDIEGRFGSVELHVRLLAPLAVALQKLTIERLSSNDELRKVTASNSAFGLLPGTVLDCGSNGNGMAYQAEGWSLPEGVGTWTNGPRAGLAARLVEWPADGIILQIAAHPFLVKDRHLSLAVEVLANGVVLDRWSYRYPGDNGWVIRSARIPASLLAASPVLKIELQIDQPAVPQALGVSTDDRQLGLFVSSVSFLSEREAWRGHVMWRMTAPIRGAKRAARWLVTGTWSWITLKPGSRPRRVARIFLKHVSCWLNDHPRLQARVLRMRRWSRRSSDAA